MGKVTKNYVKSGVLEEKMINAKKGTLKRLFSCMAIGAMAVCVMTGCSKENEEDVKTVLANEEQGVSIEGDCGAAVKIEVNTISEDNSSHFEVAKYIEALSDLEQYAVYDIVLREKNDCSVQSEGKISITLDISDEFETEEDGVYAVYKLENDKTLKKLASKKVNNNITFETEYVGVYTVVKTVK